MQKKSKVHKENRILSKKIYIVITGILLALVVVGINQYSSNDTIYDNYEDVQSEIESDTPEFVYFGRDNCSFCVAAKPYIDEAVTDTNTDLLRIDTNKNPDALTKYAINGTPTIVKYENGVEVNRIEGYYDNAKSYSDFFETDEDYTVNT